MARAIQELQDGGVEPDIWKVEGLDRAEDCAHIVATVRRNGRDEVSCIVLGRGADEKKVSEWLTTASRVPGFIGFAVGRTTFWESLVNFRRNKISDEAAASIAGRYHAFVDVFQSGTMPP